MLWSLFERHELDEADDDVFVARELGEGFDLVVVEAAQQDAVDLDGAEAGVLGGADAVEDALEAAGNAGDAGEGFGVDRVHADGDAGEAGVFERRGEVCEQMAVGGEGDVERCVGEGGLQLAVSRIRSTRPLRSSGSPPVRRTFSMPSETKTRRMRA